MEDLNMPACTHLDQVEILEAPDDIPGCDECLTTGSAWMHLRMCQTCGKIGCCDSSPNRHASRHASEANHPVLTLRRTVKTGHGALSTTSCSSCAARERRRAGGPDPVDGS